MMTEIHRNPELADIFTEGFEAGVRFADAYRDEDTATWRGLRIGRRTLVLIRLVLIVALIGWTYGLLQMAGVVPRPVAHAAAPASVTMLQPAVHAAAALQPAQGHLTVVKNTAPRP